MKIVEARIDESILPKKDKDWKFALAANPATEGWIVGIRAEDVQVFENEIQRHRFFAVGGACDFNARSSSRAASLTPLSVSASQCPSPPDAGSTENAALPPPARNAPTSLREKSGEKYVSLSATSQMTGTRAPFPNSPAVAISLCGAHILFSASSAWPPRRLAG